MRVLIVEDEAPAARRLRRLAAEELSLDKDDITLADNLEEARRFISSAAFDLLLLDLDLSGRNGFDLLRAGATTPPATVIVSAYIDRALDAFGYGVIDFVAKPVTAERLSLALTRVREAKAGEMRLIVHAQGRTDVIPVPRITRLSGAGDYVEISITGGKCFLHDDKLDALEKRLPPSFIRVHRSHIVNMAHATQLRHLERDKNMIVTTDGEEIPISRRRIGAVKAAFGA